MVEEKHIIRGFEDYYEKYGTVITDSGPVELKIANLRALAWIASRTLHREYDFDPDELIGSTLFTKNGSPTGLMINGVIWRSKWEKN